jgi:hypothetical protein
VEHSSSFLPDARINENFIQYNKLKEDKNYFNVVYSEETGGLMATHKEHCFDPKRGIYEKMVQQIGFENGYAVILESEKCKRLGERYPEGTWNGQTFEIGTSLGTGKNNIKAILNHAREKKVKIAIIYFPNEKIYSYKRLQDGVSKYYGQTKYKFSEIIYVVNNEIHKYK